MRSTQRVTLSVAVVAALSLAACGGGGSDAGSGPTPTFSPGTTMAKIAERGSVKVGTKFDQPGFGLKGLDGKPAGFDVEIAKLVAKKLGVSDKKIEFVEAPSKVREEYLQQGKVDFVVATYTINDKRKERVSFAGPYYVAGQDLMVKSDEAVLNGPDSLKEHPEKKVCSVTGSTPAETIAGYLASPSQLVLFDVYSKCADALRTGQVSAVTTDNSILLGLVGESKGAFKILNNTFSKEPYGIGITKGDTAFCEFIHDTLTEAAGSGDYEKAWKETAGTIEGAQTPQLPTFESCS
jgi:glutamate transport system substrate-binding protein